MSRESDSEGSRGMPVRVVEFSNRARVVYQTYLVAVSRVVTFCFRYRFAICGGLFLVLFLLRVNYSSIGMYDAYLNGHPGTGLEGTLLLHPEGIRSDEWLVQTPYELAQQYTGLSCTNHLASGGTNVILVLYAPCWSPSLIGNVFHWGYILGPSFGMSWLWNLKLFGLVLSTAEFMYMLTRSKFLALSSGTGMLFSPFMMWWFSTGYVPLTICAQSIVVVAYKLLTTRRLIPRVALGALLLVVAVGFSLQFYPPMQVTFGYLILALVAYLGWSHRRGFDRGLILLLVVVGVLYIAVIGTTLLQSKDAIAAIANSVYPGHRVSLGGGTLDAVFQNYNLNLFSWLLRYRPVPFLNSCAASSMIYLLPVVVFAIPAMLRRTPGWGLRLILVLYVVGSTIWSTVTFPSWFARLTLLSYVPSNGMNAVAGVVLFYLTMMSAQALTNTENRPSRGALSILLPVTCVYYVVAVGLSQGKDYLGLKGSMVAVLVYITLSTLVLLGSRRLFVAGFLLFSFAATGAVNPIVVGTSDIYAQPLSIEIRSLVSDRPEARWLTVDSVALNNLPMANGAVSVNPTQLYPATSTWSDLDPTGVYADIYNRYAHVNVELSNTPTSFTLLQTDLFRVSLDFADLNRLDVTYVLSSAAIGDSSASRQWLEEVYSDPVSGAVIYKVRG